MHHRLRVAGPRWWLIPTHRLRLLEPQKLRCVAQDFLKSTQQIVHDRLGEEDAARRTTFEPTPPILFRIVSQHRRRRHYNWW
jgi:hypothetical protein